MADVRDLSPEMRQFVESIGLFFEHFEVSRIGGRIIGLLLVADDPLTLDDVASTLEVSRASVSTNVRMAVTYGLAELVTKPGDRRDYYRFPADAWDRDLLINIEAIRLLRRIATRGLAAAGPDDTTARGRLDELQDFCDFCLDEMQAMLDRWRARRDAGTIPSAAEPTRESVPYDGDC